MNTTKLNLSDFASLCAVIFATNHYNFDRFSNINAFAEISKAVFDKEFIDFWEFSDFQNRLFEEIKNQSQEFKSYLFKAYDRLFDEGILNAREVKELKSVFTALHDEQNIDENLQTARKEEIGQTFQEKLNALFEIADDILSINESKIQKSHLENVKKTLEERSFSIGVTGVMNAGKSTLLNAILRSNILGTAVVPETANLTLIRYSENPYAVVNFWSKSRWLEIEKSAQFLPQIAQFVKSTKEKFKEKLDEFITDEGKKVTIDIGELSSYTSAIDSDMRCNLVQSVELYADLDFLKDGVSIVDTPGLDDPVTKREEITKEYLSSCDLMIHLMNAAQSATQKDIEFIIDAIMYQGISKLLIIITRIDSISKNELQEVIEYTKNSIKLSLEKYNKSSFFNSILQKLEFIPVAGKLALMHRTDLEEEALKLGYDEEQTGIFQVESYLNDTLFGENSPKANLLIASNAKTLHLAAKECEKIFLKESFDLNRSSDELKTELDSLRNQNMEKGKEIEKLLLNVKASIGEIKEFGFILLGELDTRVAKLQNIIFSRIYDDTQYEFRKNNKKPNQERISYMIQSGIKDGVVDLVRDYRFSFNKRSVAAQEKLLVLFENAKLDLKSTDFNAKDFLDASGVNLDFSTIIPRVLGALKKCSKAALDKFADELNYVLNDEFSVIKKEITYIMENLNLKLIRDFTIQNEEPLKGLKEEMQEEIERLNRYINTLDSNKQEAKIRYEVVEKKLSNLLQIKDKLLSVTGSKNGSI